MAHHQTGYRGKTATGTGGIAGPLPDRAAGVVPAGPAGRERSGPGDRPGLAQPPGSQAGEGGGRVERGRSGVGRRVRHDQWSRWSDGRSGDDGRTRQDRHAGEDGFARQSEDGFARQSGAGKATVRGGPANALAPRCVPAGRARTSRGRAVHRSREDYPGSRNPGRAALGSRADAADRSCRPCGTSTVRASGFRSRGATRCFAAGSAVGRAVVFEAAGAQPGSIGTAVLAFGSRGFAARAPATPGGTRAPGIRHRSHPGGAAPARDPRRAPGPHRFGSPGPGTRAPANSRAGSSECVGRRRDPAGCSGSGAGGWPWGCGGPGRRRDAAGCAASGGGADPAGRSRSRGRAYRGRPGRRGASARPCVRARRRSRADARGQGRADAYGQSGDRSQGSARGRARDRAGVSGRAQSCGRFGPRSRVGTRARVRGRGGADGRGYDRIRAGAGSRAVEGPAEVANGTGDGTGIRYGASIQCGAGSRAGAGSRDGTGTWAGARARPGTRRGANPT